MARPLFGSVSRGIRNLHSEAAYAMIMGPPWRPHNPSSNWTHHPIVKAQGPDKSNNPAHQTDLQKQLDGIPRDTRFLSVEENTPSNTEWALLGERFSNVESLELDSGFEETLNDENIPLHWPLQRLQLSSACGELIRSPFVRQGRVPHLSLSFTSGLRFEGPTTDELVRAHREAIARGEKEKKYISDKKQIEYLFLPELVVEHMSRVYSDPDRKPDPENEVPPGPINLKTLEICENDAIDTFCRMSAALPHLVNNLDTLRLRSTRGHDFTFLGQEVYREILHGMDKLQTLNLTVGEVLEDPSNLPSLYEFFPPNLTTLYFRGPASLTQSEKWEKWLEAFESPEFLPKLQRLGFVLDLHYEAKEKNCSETEDVKAPEQVLRQAREACEPLYESARRRDIRLEAMPAEPDSFLLRPVDERW